MTETQDSKLLFRLQHIIPRSLSASPWSAAQSSQSTQLSNPQQSDPNGPEELQFQMTWGKVAAKAWGPPNGRPVIAIHGWLDNAATFDKLIPLLPKDLRIIAVDIAGHGLSDHFPPDIAYNFLDGLLAIERLVAHFKWEKFSFLGHSLGAGLAIMYAGIFPEKVDKVVSLDIVRVQTTIPETIGYRLRKTVGVLLNQEAEILAGPEKPCSYETAVKRNVLGSGGSLNSEACTALFTRGLLKVNDGYVFTRDRRLRAAPLLFVPKEDQILLAQQVTAEILIIKFKKGPYFEHPKYYQQQLEALKTKAKRVEYVEVDGKHHAHLTNPENMAQIICDFFNS